MGRTGSEPLIVEQAESVGRERPSAPRRPRGKTVVMVPRRPLRTVAVVVLLLAVVAGGVAGWLALREPPPPPLVVPDVVGQDISAAHELLLAQGFTIALAPAVPSDAVVPLAVVEVDPVPGTTLEPDQVVTLTFSSGIPDIPVPDVVGLAVPEAEAALRAAGFAIGPRSEQPDGVVPAGAVVRADPPPRTALPPAVPIALVVSSGPPPVVLPRLVGLPEAVAVDQLRQAGLVPQVISISSADAPADQVISQTPEAGLEVAPGTAVTVTVSTGAP